MEVNQWYGTYDLATKPPDPLDDRPSATLDPPVVKDWSGPVKAERTYHIGFAFPHLMDPYWISVLYGVIDEGRLCGVDVTAYVAGGYGELTRQISQVEALMELPVDAIVMSVISYGALTPVLQEALDRGIAVIININDTNIVYPSAKSLACYYDLGVDTANIVINHSEEARAAGEELEVAFFPGPGGLTWSTAAWYGFRDRIAELGLEEELEVVAVKWGLSEKAVQLALIEPVLVAYPEIDYLAGNAVFAPAAILPVEAAGRTGKTHIASTYTTQPVYWGIKEGKIIGAPAEWQQQVGRISVDMAVRILNGEQPGVDFPYRVGPIPVLLTKENVVDYPWEHLFEPEGWEPMFRYSVPAGLRVD